MSIFPGQRHQTFCHGALLLLLTAATAFSATAQELPTPEEIIARHVEASGGEHAIRATTSMTSKGTFNWPAVGVSGDTTVYTMAPDKSLSRLVAPDLVEIVEAYNGEVGWMEDPDGVRLLNGEMLADFRHRTRFYASLEYADLYPKRNTVGETEWNGQTAYRVDLVDADGKEHSHYFSISTGLLIGAETTMATGVNTRMKVATSYSDHEDFGGVVVATSTTFETMGMEFLLSVDTITWNDVDASVFEFPDAIGSRPSQ